MTKQTTTTFDIKPLVEAVTSAAAATATAGQQARILADLVKSQIKGKRGSERLRVAEATLSDARERLAAKLESIKVAGKAVTTSPESRKVLNTFRVALKRAMKPSRLDVAFGLKAVTVKALVTKKATDSDETGTDSGDSDTGTDGNTSNLSVYVTEATRRDAILRALDNEAKAFISGAVKAGMDKAAAEAEFLEAVEGWATAARDALQREAEAAKAARKGKGRRKAA